MINNSISTHRYTSSSYKMVAKFVVLFAVMAVACADSYNSFSYAVADPYTGDFKHQVESRANNNVLGQYSLLESDGTRRTVDYAAGAEGFNAVVRKDPALIAPYAAAPIPYVAAPIPYAAAHIPYAAAAYPYGYGLRIARSAAESSSE